jgi:arylsulfatase A-like enzyme
MCLNRFPIPQIRLRYLLVVGLSLGLGLQAEPNITPPNIILIMADDLGYGDTGFNGNQIIQTPHLDALAQRGVKLTHFYSGNSVCSSTRATVLTGRHHDRMGIYTANAGHLPAQEITLARMLKQQGYTTGHFGKWHLGTLSPIMSSKGQARKPAVHFAPPWLRDYDTSFVTESAVSTWDPGLGPRAEGNPFFADGVPVPAEDPALLGGAARVVADRAVPFMQNALGAGQPFFAVVWFHAPHEDIAAGPDYLKRYEGYGEAAHFYGCITEMDEQVGRIVKTLADAQASENTLIFFCSDNGPEGKTFAPESRRAGTTDGLRGRKRALYDGGVRVPAFAVWPAQIPASTQSDTILTTLDYFPTIQQIFDYRMPDTRPLDGENILPILQGKSASRSRAIPFRFQGGESSLVKDGYKYLLPTNELFNLAADRAETRNLALTLPARAKSMRTELISFFESVEASHAGADYADPSFSPSDKWKPLQLSE